LRAIGPVGALPDFLPGHFVERQQGALRAAGCADDLVAIDEHRLGVTPAWRLATELGHADFPELLAGRGIGANDEADAAHGIDTVAVHCRRRARAVAPAVLEQRSELGRPYLVAGPGIDGDEKLHVAAQA